MNGRKARALRKELGMTVENSKQKDYKLINIVKKVVHFKNKLGELAGVKAERGQIVNGNLNYYRQRKKLLKKRL